MLSYLGSIARRLIERVCGRRGAAQPDPRRRMSPDARAFWLLRHLLEREQREQFDRFRCFTVDVEGRGTFAVLPQLAFSVVNVRSGDSYCVVSESPVPMGDHMLIQKLMLENEPERFFAVARRRPEPGPLDPRVLRLLASPAGTARRHAPLQR